MTVPWSRKPGPGAPLQFRAAHGLWRISAPDRREGSVELGYVRQYARGRLPGVPLPIGVFSSTAEATLAVELHEAALAGEPVPGVPVAMGGVTRVGIIYGHVRPSRHLMTAAGYRRARVKAVRIWRQETCVQIGT